VLSAAIRRGSSFVSILAAARPAWLSKPIRSGNFSRASNASNLISAIAAAARKRLERRSQFCLLRRIFNRLPGSFEACRRFYLSGGGKWQGSIAGLPSYYCFFFDAETVGADRIVAQGSLGFWSGIFLFVAL
jgi:hypothetical protein